MALYCKKCKKEFNFVLMMNAHVRTCSGVDTTMMGPKAVSEQYFTTTRPGAAAPAVDLELVYAKTAQVIREALSGDVIRPTVRAELEDTLNKENKIKLFQHANFKQRLNISGHAPDTVYYRKMSEAEWSAAEKEPIKKRFDATFNYLNKDLYRYWVSSSLAKVRIFGNEDTVGTADVIVKMTFSKSLLTVFAGKIKAHQKGGETQGNKDVVAIHREGFAETGNLSSDKDVKEIVNSKPLLDFNLGFTSSQSKQLGDLLVSAVKV